jgi:hypothetical protein
MLNQMNVSRADLSKKQRQLLDELAQTVRSSGMTEVQVYPDERSAVERFVEKGLVNRVEADRKGTMYACISNAALKIAKPLMLILMMMLPMAASAQTVVTAIGNIVVSPSQVQYDTPAVTRVISRDIVALLYDTYPHTHLDLAMLGYYLDGGTPLFVPHMADTVLSHVEGLEAALAELTELVNGVESEFLAALEEWDEERVTLIAQREELRDLLTSLEIENDEFRSVNAELLAENDELITANQMLIAQLTAARLQIQTLNNVLRTLRLTPRMF